MLRFLYLCLRGLEIRGYISGVLFGLMDAAYFFGMIGQFETNRIQAYRGQIDSSALHKIPRPFGMLMHNIIDILHTKLRQLCQLDEKILLIGFQPVAIKYYSDLPLQRQRIYNAAEKRVHFCCTLEYITVPIEKSSGFKWQATQSILIDFSSGMVMDREYFLGLLLQSSDNNPKGILGMLDDKLLNTAWQIFRLRESPRH